jgi:putative transposase
MKKKPTVPIATLLTACELSNNGWYSHTKEKAEPLALKAKIESVLMESPYYGYRRVTAELQSLYEDEPINHKYVRKIMGRYCLLQVRRKKFAPKTTDSRHKFVIYTNEIKDLGPVLVPSLVWVSDVTYIWIGKKWAYLALVMDQGSRKIVGWCMGMSLHKELCVEALTMALQGNKAPLYHHSDRGVQYCSNEYIRTLKENNIRPSMADVGMSVDNPYAESLNRSIKVEEVYLHAYESFSEAKESIEKYIMVYNTRRLHSSLGYISPMKFEANYQLSVAKIS